MNQGNPPDDPTKIQAVKEQTSSLKAILQELSYQNDIGVGFVHWALPKPFFYYREWLGKNQIIIKKIMVILPIIFSKDKKMLSVVTGKND